MAFQIGKIEVGTKNLDGDHYEAPRTIEQMEKLVELGAKHVITASSENEAKSILSGLDVENDGSIDYFYFEINDQVKMQKTTFHTDELAQNAFENPKLFKALSTKKALEVLRHSHMFLQETNWCGSDSFSAEDAYTKNAIIDDKPWNMFTSIDEILAVRKAINIMQCSLLSEESDEQVGFEIDSLQEQIDSLAYENKNMAEFIKFNNKTLTDFDVGDIATSTYTTGVWDRFKIVIDPPPYFKSLVHEVHKGGEVCFMNPQDQIAIIELGSEGYNMKIIEQDSAETDSDVFREVDGGICTGDAKDAVEWCMEWGLDKKDNTKPKQKMKM